MHLDLTFILILSSVYSVFHCVSFVTREDYCKARVSGPFSEETVKEEKGRYRRGERGGGGDIGDIDEVETGEGTEATLAERRNPSGRHQRLEDQPVLSSAPGSFCV